MKEQLQHSMDMDFTVTTSQEIHQRKEGFLCRDFDSNEWVLLEADLTLKEGIELEILNTNEELSKCTWDKAVVKFNKDFNELALYMYDTGNFKKVSSNYLVRINYNRKKMK
ncbi:hypothetical protein CF088_19210 [Clostridium botulinum]|uniref:hypothetical protein n=1 Tax=Clostridium botulinum TaxID=1491 RepID=UPI000773AE9E|nr:hypothetical protein [Clostridium botulinum]APH22440.1 hypothetical protein NPD1_3056 [Clostridium botulinum]APQ70253.1 hypothetical protein RSJ8_1182 [Clostridium botulinum]MBN3380752.1 hypothetical protein [Clostridium botulinum]MBN3407353.1 hypothetical protein [Clostridium botulinum]QDY17208.1 hypothetical protein CGQ27_08915 [Clostridium botulinum]